MSNHALIEATKTFVKENLKDAEGGHDWFHIERVYKNALLIAKGEAVDLLVVTLGALLHDIADSKFHNGDSTIGPKVAGAFLLKHNVDSATINHVIKIIENISYSSNIGVENAFKSIELDVVQDADRLDAIGAIGIARTFNYGGFKNRTLYNPEIKPNLNLTKAPKSNVLLSFAPVIKKAIAMPGNAACDMASPSRLCFLSTAKLPSIPVTAPKIAVPSVMVLSV